MLLEMHEYDVVVPGRVGMRRMRNGKCRADVEAVGGGCSLLEEDTTHSIPVLLAGKHAKRVAGWWCTAGAHR